MSDDIKQEKQGAVGHRSAFHCYAVPVAVVLGLLSIAMLLWTSALHQRQRANFALVDALKDLQIKTGAAHLWLEEASAERKNAYYETVWSNLAEARSLSRAILQGGETRYGLIERISWNRNLAQQAEKINRLLAEFEELAKQRQTHPEAGGIGLELDERIDHIYGEILGAVGTLEDVAGRKLRSGYIKMTRLFIGIVIAWSLIVTAATAGLWNRETKRKRAEEALQDAKDELEVKVAERTQALAAANRQLNLELAERMRAEAEKAVLQKGAERAAHLAALGELAAGTAHEINNPVSGIISCAEILVNKTASDSREHDLGRRILKEGSRIAFIVQGLLSFAREEAQEKLPLQVHEILTDTLTLTEAQLRKEGITLQMDINGDALPVCVQPQRLEQVFLNIINNARDALNEKYPEKAEGKTLRIIAKRVIIDGRPQVSIVFHDLGTGIPAPVRNRIMEPFFSTKPKGKGTGLGLSITQGIVANCGGKLTIASVEGEFTEVTVVLPLLETR